MKTNQSHTYTANYLALLFDNNDLIVTDKTDVLVTNRDLGDFFNFLLDEKAKFTPKEANQSEEYNFLKDFLDRIGWNEEKKSSFKEDPNFVIKGWVMTLSAEQQEKSHIFISYIEKYKNEKSKKRCFEATRLDSELVTNEFLEARDIGENSPPIITITEQAQQEFSKQLDNRLAEVINTMKTKYQGNAVFMKELALFSSKDFREKLFPSSGNLEGSVFGQLLKERLNKLRVPYEIRFRSLNTYSSIDPDLIAEAYYRDKVKEAIQFTIDKISDPLNLEGNINKILQKRLEDRLDLFSVIIGVHRGSIPEVKQARKAEFRDFVEFVHRQLSRPLSQLDYPGLSRELSSSNLDNPERLKEARNKLLSTNDLSTLKIDRQHPYIELFNSSSVSHENEVQKLYYKFIKNQKSKENRARVATSATSTPSATAASSNKRRFSRFFGRNR